MKINTNPVRGTYDYAPKQAELREEVRQIPTRIVYLPYCAKSPPLVLNYEILYPSNSLDFFVFLNA